LVLLFVEVVELDNLVEAKNTSYEYQQTKKLLKTEEFVPIKGPTQKEQPNETNPDLLCKCPICT